MVLSLNCIILGDTTTFPITLGDKITLDDMQYNIGVFRISNLKQYIFSKKKESKLSGISDPDDLVLWKFNVSKDKLEGVYTTEHIMNKLNGEKMDEVYFISQYFDVNQHPDTNIHIIVVPPAATAGPSQQGIPQYEIRRKEEVLNDAESHWEKLKDKLIETIELEEFRVSDHIYKDNINASGIPVINNEPRFILHSLPDFDDEQGYLDKEILNALFNDVMKNPWLFLLGTSGSGKTRSLYELLCKTLGIYLSLSAGNGSKNLGSKDMDISISELSVYLTNDPEKNIIYALRFTHAILLGRLFILNKLLVYNQGCNRNFTPKQWLLMQLLPRQIGGNDFWVPISRVFRGLSQEDQDGLIGEYIEEFHTLIPEQGKLPITIDESQVAITKHQARFSTTLADGPLRPFFAILLRTVLDLSTGNLCLVLSGTGMSFDDINNYTASAIAKSGGATYNNFFSMHDGFYKYEEMKEFIQRFLPLDDKLIRATFNIFRGRRRFVIQFLEHALKDSSTFKSNLDEIVKDWQDKARDFIIKTFMDSCFPRLHKKKEAWSKMRDIVILSLFSHDTILMKGDGVSQMVQYGFAQLDNIRHLADLNTLNENAITVKIAEPIPIIAFREYLNKHPNELETQLYQNLNSVHYNAVCAGFLFEPCLTIHLAELFNGKICKDHILFRNIDNMNKLDLLLSCKTTIRNLDDCNVTTLCSEGSMEKENLPAFLENPTTAFFKPESVAGPDLVCIVQFHTINGIIEIPLFLQEKLVKNKPSTTAKDTTNPNYFYAHDGPTPEPKRELKKKVLDCLRSKYCKARELSWIRFLVVYPSEAGEESKYIERNNPRLKRAVASNFNDLTANELFIVISPSNAEHFFSSFGHQVLKVVKRVADSNELELEERETKKVKTSNFNTV